MADRRSTRTNSQSRLMGLSQLHSSYSPGASISSIRPESFVLSQGGLLQTSGMSPTLERRTQDRSFPSLSSSASDLKHLGVDHQPSDTSVSIRIRMLPRDYDQASLRSLLLFSELLGCYLTESEDGPACLSAIATFASLAQACDARERLNGKQVPGHVTNSNMIVEIVQQDDLLTSRRNTIDVTNARHKSLSAASSASSSNNNTALARHNSRYSFSLASMHDGSPPLRSPEATARMQDLFSPTSPVVNGISGNSLMHDDMGDEETGQLLNETLPHSRNGGQYSAPRRAPNSDMLASSFNGLSLNTTLSNGYNSSMTSPPDSGNMSSSYLGVQSSSNHVSPSNNWTFNRPRQSMPPANPADQNPPCNTLYVGNLPPNTCEDELKSLFSKQRGYRRLCFRTKQNGPMCFVEFDDINYAAQSLDNLYGTMLNNSIKGGIRLSFSKNPLGIRGQSGPNSPMSTQVMVSGFSNGAGPPFATANGPPPGLPAPAAARGPANFSRGPAQANPGRMYSNGIGSMSSSFSSQSQPQPNPAMYRNHSLNGHFAGQHNGPQHMYGGSGSYTTSPNGPFGGLSDPNLT